MARRTGWYIENERAYNLKAEEEEGNSRGTEENISINDVDNGPANERRVLATTTEAGKSDLPAKTEDKQPDVRPKTRRSEENVNRWSQNDETVIRSGKSVDEETMFHVKTVAKSMPSVRRKRIWRVLPILCDDEDNIDILDNGDAATFESSRENDDSGVGRGCERDTTGCGRVQNCGQDEGDLSHENKSSFFEFTTSSHFHEVEQPRQKDTENKKVSLCETIMQCFGARRNKQRHNRNVNFNAAQTIGDFDVFLSSASDIPKPDAKAKAHKQSKDADFDEGRGCCYDCLFLCKPSEDLNDELLGRTYKYREQKKNFEDKLKQLEEEQNTYLEKAQKRYEDLVWGKEDFIYDCKEIDFQLKAFERELHHNPTPIRG